MKAIVSEAYGPPDRLELRDFPVPEVGEDGVLVRVRAASLNPLDWHLLTGSPGLVRLEAGFRKPKRTIPGVDFAGVVEAVGSAVSSFEVGDEVFGEAGGSLAEFVRATEKGIVAKPANVSFEEAAAVPIAAITALQAIRDKGHVQEGQNVLVNGASGGVGTFAVQMASSIGASVTAVCSSRNEELVRSLGADEVIDYTSRDFTKTSDRFDVVIDNIGSRRLRDLRAILKPTGSVVFVGAPKKNWAEPLIFLAKSFVYSKFTRQRFAPMLATTTKDDLLELSAMLESGQVKPVIERTYELGEAAKALGHLEEGHVRGKLVVTI